MGPGGRTVDPLTQEHWNIAPVYYAPVFLERGTELNCIVSLGLFRAEFSPGEEYRFAAAVIEGDRETQIKYYTCPFAVTEAGQA